MFGLIVLAFLTPIGRDIFSLSVIQPMHWVISLGIIVLSSPLITKIVDIFRVRVNKKFKVKTT